MKIKRVTVKQLFNLFNHEISLNSTEGVTIIHGPNGFGKTVMLNMIYKLFHSDYYIFYNIPFEEFTIYLDNGNILTVKRNVKSKKLRNKNSIELIEISIEYKEAEKQDPNIFKIPSFDSASLGFPIGIISSEIPELERIGPRLWYNSKTLEKMSMYKVLEIYGDALPINQELIAQEPEWFKDIKKSLKIHLIETQRLMKFKKHERSPYHFREIDRETSIPVVNEYARKLASNIESTFAAYGSLSQSLDRTFPLRSLDVEEVKKYTIRELKTHLLELENKRSNFVNAGVLDAETKINFEDFFKKININNKHMISVYVTDTQNKLSVFDELYNKIRVFTRIINSRFLYKKLSVSKSAGYTIKMNSGETIPPNVLSSGEQNELILFFELLFNVSPNSLILIDEPELSLHVEWQEKFLNDLLEITKIIGFDALIATHSPEIINDRWNLTVELKGPGNVKE